MKLGESAVSRGWLPATDQPFPLGIALALPVLPQLGEDAMRYRLLGHTGLYVSELCLGTMT